MTSTAVTSRASGGSSAPRSAKWRADIQGLRAIAILLVVVYHVGRSAIHSPLEGGFLPGGFIGVDVFFVVSGFVIAGLLLPQVQTGNQIRFAAFYERRARRLLPALALMLTVVAILSVVLLSPLGPQYETGRTGAAASVFAANLQLFRNVGYFDFGADHNALLNTWSLAVEEQFYLVFPAFLLIAWRIGRRVQRRLRVSPLLVLGSILAVAALASFVLSYYESTRVFGFAFYSAPTRAWEFLAGALLAFVVPQLERIPKKLALLAGIAGALVLAVGAIRISAANPYPGGAALLPVIGTVLLLVAGTATTVGITRLLGVRPMVWLGDLSYSWYLWHWPLIVFAWAMWPSATWEIAIVAVVSLVPAWLSYRFLENRLRFDTRIVGRRAVVLVAICVLVPLTACLALQRGSFIARDTAVVQHIARDVLPSHSNGLRGCNTGVPLGPELPSACTYGVPDAHGEIVVLGDSFAGMYTEPIVRAAHRLGYDVTTATHSSCPYADVFVEQFGNDQGTCRQYITKSLDEVLRHPPSLVILAASSTGYVEGQVFRLTDPTTGEVASSPASRARLYERGMQRTLRKLRRAGIPTLLVHVIPGLPDYDITGCPAVRIYLDASDCNETLSASDVRAARGRSIATENEAIAAVDGVDSIDLKRSVCGRRGCTSHRDDLWYFRDPGHLTVPGAITLTDRFEDHLRALVRPSP